MGDRGWGIVSEGQRPPGMRALLGRKFAADREQLAQTALIIIMVITIVPNHAT